ncbi:MAG: hypothetical protein H7A51_19150 [Akkermansiaceae bacterium]|nr:hypothetical protein [Akkermansiaceae bacterium]
MNKNTLTLALVAASIAVTCAQLVAGIRIEAVGVASSQLDHCPAQKTLPVQNYFQYRVFGHFSLLTLGDAPVAPQPEAPLLTRLPGPSGDDRHGSGATGKMIAWNRLFLTAGDSVKPLDIFKSSPRSRSTTGTVQSHCSSAQTSDWSKSASPPMVRIEGNTRNPDGAVVLCVDFIPAPPVPQGQILLSRTHLRNGEKIPVAWKIHR